MNRTATIQYRGVALVCQFAYYGGSAGTLETPPEPETCEFVSVRAGAVDILPVLTEDQRDELEGLCLEFVNDEMYRQRSQRDTQRMQWRQERIAAIHTPFDGSAATR